MNPYGFMPHGFCFEWRPGVLWLHVVSDLGIAIAYFGIASVLFYFVRKRRDLPFQQLFWLFATFISLCATTHLLSIWVLWHPDYYVEGFVKAATALASVATLVALSFVLPRVMQAGESLEALITTKNQELSAANRELQAQIAAREVVESAMRQSQKMEAIGQLTGGIAHDFNNMLQAIGGSLQMMEMRIVQGRGGELGRHMHNARMSVDRAARLTHRLLAFARRQPLQPRAVALDQHIHGLHELIRNTMAARDHEISLHLDLHDGDWPVLCDPNQLESALLNIAINARDAMQAGGQLRIVTSRHTLNDDDLAHHPAEHDGAQSGDYVEIAITDTGTGMDEASRARVFEPFFTTKPIGQGTGLGLSQVYGFARQSGGLVWLDSSPGAGTTVHLLLRRCDAAAPGGTPEPAVSAARPSRPYTLLLVEHDSPARHAVAEYLRGLGYRVNLAEDAAAGLSLSRAMPELDLLITDIGLPNGMNGRQLADALREHRPNLPVLLIIGDAGGADRDRLKPPMQIARKPFNLPALAAQAAKILERQPQG